MRIDPIRRSTLGEAEHAEAEIKSVRLAVRCIHPLTCGHTGGHARLKPLRFHRPRPRLTRCQAKPSRASAPPALRCVVTVCYAVGQPQRPFLTVYSESLFTNSECCYSGSLCCSLLCLLQRLGRGVPSFFYLWDPHPILST